ncbi:MAG: flagellar protein FliT [Anaerovibrio sp.]|nr:flagellar protein FliT [Anaerovibrio sp.]
MAQPPVVKKSKPVFTEKELWEKYWLITQELLKFIKAEDIDTFLDLVDQRQRLMEMLKAVPAQEQTFSSTPECAELKERIKPLDMQIMYKARTWLNKSRHNNIQVRSYDVGGYGGAASRINQES